MLTTEAKQRAIPAAIAAVAPREELQAGMPDMRLDVGTAPDPEEARKLVSNQRFGKPGTTPTLTLAVEDTLAPAGELVAKALDEHEVKLRVKLESVPANDLPGRLESGKAPDVVLVSQETLDTLSESVVSESVVVL